MHANGVRGMTNTDDLPTQTDNWIFFKQNIMPGQESEWGGGAFGF